VGAGVGLATGGAGVETGAGVGVETGVGAVTGAAVVGVEDEPDADVDDEPDAGADVLTGAEVGLDTGESVDVPKPRPASPGTRPEPQPVTAKARVSNASLGRIPGMHYSLVALKKEREKYQGQFLRSFLGEEKKRSIKVQ
jgi:hypothetical protein